MLSQGSVVEDLFGRLFRVGNTGAGCVALTLIEDGRLSGKSKIRSGISLWLFYLHRKDLTYSLLGGLKENSRNDNFPITPSLL